MVLDLLVSPNFGALTVCLIITYAVVFRMRGGQVWREEQSGTFQTIEPGVPDFNPMGCQKGASWSQSPSAISLASYSACST